MIVLYIVIAMVVVIGLFVMFGNGSSAPNQPPQNITDSEIRDLMQKGQKIQAIKEYRNLHGVGLKEAKDAVERM